MIEPNGKPKRLRTRLPQHEEAEGQLIPDQTKRPVSTRELELPAWVEDPTLSREEVITIVSETLACGLGFATAAARAGIDETTLQTWRQKDKKLNARLEQVRADAAFRVTTKLGELIEAGDLKAIERWLKTRTSEFQDKQSIHMDVGYDPDEAFL